MWNKILKLFQNYFWIILFHILLRTAWEITSIINAYTHWLQFPAILYFSDSSRLLSGFCRPVYFEVQTHRTPNFHRVSKPWRIIRPFTNKLIIILRWNHCAWTLNSNIHSCCQTSLYRFMRYDWTSLGGAGFYPGHVIHDFTTSRLMRRSTPNVR